MRKSIYLLLLLLFSENNLFPQEYQRLVDTSNRWNYVYYPPTISGDNENIQKMTYSFFLSNDTIVNNTKYVKLMCDVYTYLKPETHYVGALREDTIKQQVFFMNPANEESLAYSFNPVVGDTILVDSIGFYDGYVLRRVKSIDTVDFGGIQRKRIEVCDTLYKYTTPLEIFSDYWVEGIGSFKQLIDTYPFIYEQYPPMTLLCFWHGDEMIYDNPAYDSCVYVYCDSPRSIESIHSHEDIILYPNPVSGLLHVSCNEPVREIELLDMEGNLLQTTSTNELDVFGLVEGIYFVRVTTESSRVLIERFIKRAQ